MGQHYKMTLHPVGGGGPPGGVPGDSCVVEAKQTEGVNGAPQSTIVAETTPVERGIIETEAIPMNAEGEEEEEPKGKGTVLAPPKPPEFFDPCGSWILEWWDNESGDLISDADGVHGIFVNTNDVAIEAVDFKVNGPITTAKMYCQNIAFRALDTQLPSLSYENKTDIEIVQSLVNTYMPDIGVDLTTTGQTFPHFDIGGCTVAEALSFMAAATGGVWYGDGPNNKIVFHANSNNPNLNPTPVSTSNPTAARSAMTEEARARGMETYVEEPEGTDTPNIKKDTAKVKKNKYEVTNKVVIDGGKEETPRNETARGDGKKDEYHTSFPPIVTSLLVTVTPDNSSVIDGGGMVL